MNSVLIYIISIVTFSFLLLLAFGTSYKIEEELLKIKPRPFRSTVPIVEIKSLNTTKNILARTALSIDRIAILYSQYDLAIVSPKDKNKFIQALIRTF